MKTKWCVLVYLLAATLVHAQTNNLTALLQRGLFEEQANRNLDAAIADYQSIAARFDKDRQLAATAIFRLGECYRMQGKTNEAVVQYRRVLREFSEEETLATLSQQNLTALGRTPETRTASSEGAIALEKAAAAAEAEAVSLMAQLHQLKHLSSKAELQAVILQNYPNPLLTKLTQQLSDAEQNLIKMSMDMTTNNPRYIAAEKVLQKIHQEIDAQLEGTLTGMQVKVDTALATAKSLRAQAGQPSAMPAGEAAGIPTDPEDQEVRRLQQMLQNSPDLINTPVNGSTPLVKAAYHGWLRAATYLLNHGADVNLSCSTIPGVPELLSQRKLSRIITPLLAAVEEGNRAMTELLIAHGADVNCKDGRGRTPLQIAAEKGFEAVTRVLLANGANLNARDDSGDTPLSQATYAGQSKIVQILLNAGASPNVQDKRHNTPLTFAAQKGPADIVKMLLAGGADPNVTNEDGRTPLSYAADLGSLEAIKSLLSAKADPNGGKVDAPLLCAIHNVDVASAKPLLQAGAKPDAKGSVTWNVSPPGSFGAPPVNGREYVGVAETPFSLAVGTKQLQMVRLLLRFKANPNDSQTDGRSLLFDALSDTNILEALLDAGANVGARDRNRIINADRVNWTPLDAAAFGNNVPAAETLLKHGADPNLRDAIGNTALHWAVSYRHGRLTDLNRNMVELLLDHGADPNLRNNAGYTALDWVKNRLAQDEHLHLNSEDKPSEIADLLRRHGALDNLPDWNRIGVSRPSAHFSTAVFQRSTNDWNQFTLFETLLHCYQSSQTYRVYQGNGTWAGYPANTMMPFPDLTRVAVLRPSRASTNETRIVLNLLNRTNGIDCARDIPLQFGDVVEIPEREHTLAERDTLTPAAVAAMENCLQAKAGQAELVVVGGQTIQVPLKDFEPHDCYVGTVLRSPLAQGVLTSDSDLSRVKVIRQDPKTSKQREWILNCSPQGSPVDATLAIRLQSISSRLNEGNSQLTSGLWLRNGDVIEVPEK